MKSRLNYDKLEITYENNEVFREQLENKKEFKTQNFELTRNSTNTNYRNHFEVKLIDGSNFGTLDFGSYNINRQKIYLSINNEVLYNSNIKYLSVFQNEFKLVFSQVSRLDLAMDFNYNILNRFYKIIRDEEFEIIILNKKYSMNDEVSELLNVSTGTRNNIHKFKSFYISNKEKGLTLNCYNKKKEIIDNGNSKSYILDDFNYTNVYRLEIRTYHHILIDSLKKLGFTDEYLYQIITYSLDEELLLLYKHLLNRLIRIKYKNSIYSLTDFL